MSIKIQYANGDNSYTYLSPDFAVNSNSSQYAQNANYATTANDSQNLGGVNSSLYATKEYVDNSSLFSVKYIGTINAPNVNLTFDPNDLALCNAIVTKCNLNLTNSNSNNNYSVSLIFSNNTQNGFREEFLSLGTIQSTDSFQGSFCSFSPKITSFSKLSTSPYVYTNFVNFFSNYTNIASVNTYNYNSFKIETNNYVTFNYLDCKIYFLFDRFN